ncbi:tetratricopeptide repeat-containing diguanylate cyclase [Aliikangiella maris]|uniref:tetratricopeptide repeat-containing diguanylate cyclase n=1 Tax=Aliikangiella maris TaxID=3162458 RepID=UPI003457826C
MFKYYFILLVNLLAIFQLSANSQIYDKLYGELFALDELVVAKPVEALERLDLMDKKLVQSDPRLHLFWLLRQAEASNYSYHFEQFESSVSQAKDLINLSTPSEIANRINFLQGVIYQRKGDYQAAIKILTEVVNALAHHKKQRLYVRALIELAYTRSLAEQFETSLLELQHAFELATQMGSELLLGITYETYGALYGYMDKREDSIMAYQKAHKIYLALNYPYYIGESAFGIATTYRYWGKPEKALDWYKRYIGAVNGLNKTYTEFFYFYGVAMILAEENNCEAALPMIESALNVAEFKDYRAELFKQKALCSAKRQKFADASEALNQAKKIYLQMPALIGTSWEIEVQKIEAQVMALSGDYQKAYALLENYYRQLLAVKQNNVSNRLENLRLKIMNEREQLELIKLEKQSAIQQLKLNEQLQEIKLQETWLMISVVLFIIIVGIAWWQYQVSRKLKALAITDELTGLSNRRLIFTTIDRMLKSGAKRKSKARLGFNSHQPVHHTLMLIDVDDLKPINDEYGHQDGDKVIKMVADAGRQVLRDGDVFARIGGDEYMLFLTRTNEQLELDIAKRIIEQVGSTKITTESGNCISVSVSIGVVSITDLDVDPETLYGRVDSALYQAKSAGRNCVKRWQKIKTSSI